MVKVNHFNPEEHVFSEDVTVAIDSGNSVQITGDIQVNGSSLLKPGFHIVKPADQTILSGAGSDVLVNDLHLKVPLLANKIYRGRFDIWYVGNAAADIKFETVIPAGATLRRQSMGANASSNTVTTEITAPVHGTATGVNRLAYLEFYIEVAGTAGDLQLQWAQQTLHASDLSVLKGSSVTYREQ